LQNFTPRCEHNIFGGCKLQLVTYSFMNTVSPNYSTPFEDFYLVDSTTDYRKFVTNKNVLIITSVILATIIIINGQFLKQITYFGKIKIGTRSGKNLIV